MTTKKEKILENLSDLDKNQLTDILSHPVNLLDFCLLTKVDESVKRKRNLPLQTKTENPIEISHRFDALESMETDYTQTEEDVRTLLNSDEFYNSD